ncbi:MAG: ABC transporter ATP-binding protein [Dinoroseobacter sp.]|nr:ABC transporter ATP-binding protein [Dinoroseobacter sp.]
MVQPDITEKPMKSPMFSETDRANVYWFWADYLRDKMPWLILVFCMIIAQGLVYQQFLRLTEDGLRVVFENGTLRELAVICAMVFGVFMFRGVMSFTVPRISAWITSDAVAKLRGDLLHHLMTLDLAFFDKSTPGDVILRVVGQAQALGQFVGQTTVKAVRDVATVLILSIYLTYKQPVLFLSAALVLPVILLILQLVSRRIKDLNKEMQRAMNTYMNSIDETVSGMRTVKISGQENMEETRLIGETRGIRRLSIKLATTGAVVQPFIDFAAAIVYVFVIGGGGYMVLSPDFDLDGAAIIAFLVGLVMIFDPARRLAGFFVALQANLIILGYLRDLLDLEPKITQVPDAITDFDASADLVLDNVTFGYEDEAPVFRDLTLTFKGGKTTAIVGPTGSGKTTILSLLGRLYDPVEGEVRLGGTPLSQIDISALRGAFSVVAQDIVIFNSSILDNIRYVRRDATDAQVIGAAEAAELSELIAERGDAPVGPKGSQLSGGQKQRIAIARAFLRDAPIVLLDEATSALDQKTEDRVKRALGRLSAGKTTIIVAHRLSSVTDADCIHVLESGQLVESGSHAELMQKGALYATLYNAQKQGYGR